MKETKHKMSDLFPEAAVGVNGHRRGVIHTHPELCEEALGERVTAGHSERA